MRIMLIAFLLCAGMAFAGTQIETHLSCTGNCSVAQTVNNKTVSISSNESLEFASVTEADSSGAVTNMSANATGAGTAGIPGNSIEGASGITAVADSGKSEPHEGVFGWVIDFFSSLHIFAWFGDSA